MEITQENWKNILKLFGSSTRLTASPKIPYTIFATVDEDGSPRLAPYTSLVLKENQTGFFFDEFSGHMTKNLDRDKKICVLLLKTDKWFWIKTVLLGRFDHAPAIRLSGVAGERRLADPREIQDYLRPIKKLKLFRGYKSLWGGMKHGREIIFNSFETVKCGSIMYLKDL